MSPITLREYVHARPLASSLAVGVGHALLSTALSSFFGFASLLAQADTEPLYVFYSLCGLFVLGFVPAVLYSKYRSRVPLALSVFLFVGSAFGTYRVVASGLTPVDPTPFGWYLLLWPACVVLYAAISVVEKLALGS
ncbi:hypothetical protein [Halolamina sp. CBA1230]|uniref:hypothetical protein n=1 Tax=Halolamina sp. CBA1230 TaxID=1853690 RepID=UPI0020D02ECB|nr:hypothetical protein [Halolamina sp. CBA1230]